MLTDSGRTWRQNIAKQSSNTSTSWKYSDKNIGGKQRNRSYFSKKLESNCDKRWYNQRYGDASKCKR